MAIGTLIRKFNSTLFKRDINDITLDELINRPLQKDKIRNRINEDAKGTIDYFIEIVYGRLSMVDFIHDFAYNFNFLSPKDYEEILQKPLSQTKFNEYLLNDFREYCKKLYNNHLYYEENDFMAFILKQTIKQWINNIEMVYGEERKKELFEKALKQRTKMFESDYSDI